MRRQSRYWNRYWDLPATQHVQAQVVPELDTGREQLPPVLARRLLNRSSHSGSDCLRHQAAQRLQGSAGNRELIPEVAGQPLPPQLRSRLEASLNIDLSTVRLQHHEAAARALNARAFTTGNQIILQKKTDATNLPLLAHESAHIAQARQRGTQAGISQPGSTSEQEADQVARAITTGQPATLAQSGNPVPTLQRQDTPQSPSTLNDPLIRRESVRFLLYLQYQAQGSSGPLALTPDLQTQLLDLIPELQTHDLTKLWTPEPAGPIDAFQRLASAGYLPRFVLSNDPDLLPAAPIPPPPPEPESAFSIAGLGMVGAHFRLNPRVPPPISATIHQHLSSRGIPLTHKQVEALMAGREQGVEQIETLLHTLKPSLSADDARSLAETIADLLLDTSLQAQLEQEAPRTLEHFQQQLDAFKSAQGTSPDLLKRLPVGGSITVYF